MELTLAQIGLVSAAYWGDVMPFVPIADELARRGHRVTFAVPEGFHDVLGGHGFDLVHLGTDFSPRELAAHGDIMERADTVRGMRAALQLWVKQLLIDPAPEILEVLDAIAPDLWVTHNTCCWLTELAARPAGVPVVVGHLFPMMIPSSFQEPPVLPVSTGGLRVLNRLGWAGMRAMSKRLMYDEEVQALRRERGLAPGRWHVAFGWERADRILLLSSEWYWPRPADWPETITYTGFTVWGDPDATLPDDLRAYLDAGPPPVLVTLGTSAATNARDAFAMAADAIEHVGMRPLLLVGNQRNLDALGGRGDAWRFAPLPAVLPHCRAVLHAAGHGTTAAALHAATPQIVMPQGFDQQAHAERLEELGVGVRVPWERRSVSRITSALHHVQQPEVRASARSLAARLYEQDGASTAADTIEDLLDGL